jgi:hypothetical protein
MSQSWEWYQQAETGGGVPYSLYWVCGLGGSTYQAQVFPPLVLTNLTIYAVPFDQLKVASVSKMIINVRRPLQTNGKLRIGIYQNTANPWSEPARRVWDAGEITLSRPGIFTVPLTVVL